MKIPGKNNTGEQIRLQDIVIAEDMNEKQAGEIRELLNQKRQQLEREEASLKQRNEDLKQCAVRRRELDQVLENGAGRRKKRKKLLIAAVAVMLIVNGAGAAYGEWGHYRYRKEVETERQSIIRENNSLGDKAAALQDEIIGLRKQ